MAYAGAPQAPQAGGGDIMEILKQLFMAPSAQARPMAPQAPPGPFAGMRYGVPDINNVIAQLPQQPPSLGKLFTDQLPGGGTGAYTPGAGAPPNVEAQQTDGAVRWPRMGVQPGLSSPGIGPAPYAGTGGAPGPAYNPQPGDVPAGIAEPDGAPPIGGSAAPEQAMPNGMEALTQALAGLTAPPSKPPIGVATPPPPRAAPGGGGDLLAALMAMGGMGKGGPQIPPLGTLVGR